MIERIVPRRMALLLAALLVGCGADMPIDDGGTEDGGHGSDGGPTTPTEDAGDADDAGDAGDAHEAEDADEAEDAGAPEDGGDTDIEEIDPSTCPGLPTKIDATLGMYESFDSSPFANTTDHLYPSGTVTLTKLLTRAGAGAALFRVGDPQLTAAQCTRNRYRAEVMARPLEHYDWDDGVSHWIGVSINPTSFPRGAYSLFQIHGPNEPAGSSCDYAGNAISLIPSLEDDGRVYLKLAVIEHGGRSTGTGAGSGQTTVWTEPLRENEWFDLVVNLSLSTKNKGYYHIFRNGELIYSKTGLTNVNYIDSCGDPIPADKRSHYGPHIGIYGPPCGAADWMQEAAGPVHLREAVMDELRTATGPEGYLLVDPSQCGVMPPGFPRP